MMWDEVSAKLHAEIDRLTRERDAALHALAFCRSCFDEYACHTGECRGGDGEKCTCGYLNAYHEIMNGNREQTVSSHVKEPATSAELEALLNSEDDREITINPDGSVTEKKPRP